MVTSLKLIMSCKALARGTIPVSSISSLSKVSYRLTRRDEGTFTTIQRLVFVFHRGNSVGVVELWFATQPQTEFEKRLCDLSCLGDFNMSCLEVNKPIQYSCKPYHFEHSGTWPCYPRAWCIGTKASNQTLLTIKLQLFLWSCEKAHCIWILCMQLKVVKRLGSMFCTVMT